MVSEGQVDALAALGSVHGTAGEPVLGFDEMLAISEQLVLHLYFGG